MLILTALGLFILSCTQGCATAYPECAGDEACIAETKEYKRIEYLEREFLPMVRSCEAANNFLAVEASWFSHRSLKAMEDRNYNELSLLEMRNVECANSW